MNFGPWRQTFYGEFDGRRPEWILVKVIDEEAWGRPEREVDAMFEVVYTVPGWYDGPRRGIADYHGHPHLFESEWRDGENLEEDTFLLMPIDGEVFALALEDWAIWRRWETAFYQGRATQDTHPALPEDQNRHRELEHLLEGRQVVDPIRAVRQRAEFRVRHDPEWSGQGFRSLEVRWEDPL